MRDEDETGRPKRVVTHEIGSDLSAISVDELGERIELLRREIGRIEAERDRKRASKAAASAAFKF